jgi:hypothetical protein
MRPLTELIDTREHAWGTVCEWLADGSGDYRICPANRERGERTLLHLQVTTRSPLGAVALEAEHLSLDHGWLRILGAGSERVPGLAEWNPDMSRQGFLIVAHDVLGGVFALNGGGIAAAPKDLAYFAPDTLEWESFELGYSAFLQWATTDSMQQFYGPQRWVGWEIDCSGLGADQGFSIYPPLWAKGPPIGERSHKPIAILELWAVENEMRSQLRSE